MRLAMAKIWCLNWVSTTNELTLKASGDKYRLSRERHLSAARAGTREDPQTEAGFLRRGAVLQPLLPGCSAAIVPRPGDVRARTTLH
jgi:hypothetical protein